MMSNKKDILGDKIKSYESLTTSRKALKGEPIIVRLDGKAFHTFTRGIKRPYDENLTKLMVATMSFLVKEFKANIGYTQSDEITLMFYVKEGSVSEYIYGGRFQKLESLLAAAASVYFNKLLPAYLPAKQELSPIFDARAFSVPTLEESYDCFMWRQQDAMKNAVSMAAQSMFSHKSLQGKHSDEMRKMMLDVGVDFNDFPYFFKRGTFSIQSSNVVDLSEEQLMRIPEKFRANAKTCVRPITEEFDMFLSKNPDQPTYDLWKKLVVPVSLSDVQLYFSKKFRYDTSIDYMKGSLC